MVDERQSRVRYGEAFWRAHHEAWKRSEVNQREYCEAQDIPLKAFGNWRAKFKAEPQPLARKLLYQRVFEQLGIGFDAGARLSGIDALFTDSSRNPTACAGEEASVLRSFNHSLA